MSDIYITWEEYNKKIEELAIKVYEDGCKFNQVICIAKGGLRVGDVFSRLFDVPLAILAGDVLYSKAYHTISSKSKLSSNYTTQLVTKLSKACVEICEGQVDDVKLAENKRIPTEREYIKMIEKKTAVLFEVSCAMGAICAKKKPKDVKNLSSVSYTHLTLPTKA